jgi:hypothetical protein
MQTRKHAHLHLRLHMHTVYARVLMPVNARVGEGGGE